MLVGHGLDSVQPHMYQVGGEVFLEKIYLRYESRL